jgi:hypothetical protein
VRLLFAAILPAVPLLAAAPARAWEAEVNVQLDLAGGFPLSDAGEAGDGLFYMGLGTDVALFRELSREVGFGFALRTGTRGFEDFLLLGGVEVILPVFDAFPIVLESGAGFEAVSPEGMFYARIWWGARSHNMSSTYATGVGIFVQYVRPLDGDGVPTLMFGAGIDGFGVLWPLLWICEALAVDQGPAVV